MAHPLQILIVDARHTADRMIDDARHLRELGKRGRMAARFAKAQIKAKIEGGLEAFADAVIAFEKRVNGRE